MLTLLSIRNFAIVSSLDLELKAGMTVVSGETGAGKSIMLDALGLALGKRAEADSVREGANRAEISAAFDITKLSEAREWLEANELESEDAGECILRRTLTSDGRSRSYINGHPCPLNRVKELGEILVDIHGQHEHQRLLKRDHHRALLDNFAKADESATEVRTLFAHWQTKQTELKRLQDMSAEAHAQQQLLSYQTEELNRLDPQVGELEELEAEQKTLANAGAILTRGQQITTLLGEGEESDAQSLVNHALQLLGDMEADTPALQQTAEMLNAALIQIEEAERELSNFLQRVDLDPERLQEVEERLSTIYDLARKHRVAPEQLPELRDQLNEQLDALSHADENLEVLESEVQSAHKTLISKARELSKQRIDAAKVLDGEVNKQLEMLGMASARFTAKVSEVDPKYITANGLEEIEFLISTNAGQTAKPLAKIASGGELSRISLAIQVVTAQTTDKPTLIFDEVDVGIGGGIAEVVGRLLRKLSARAQVMCVTHQPQVASQGNTHLFVSKGVETGTIETRINALTEKQRVNEIARMLGGLEITNTTLEHAKEMLSASSEKVSA
jgi:DNA repair protein RecN (Recombination protein N)